MSIVTFIGGGQRLVLSLPVASSERLCLCVCCGHSTHFQAYLAGLPEVVWPRASPAGLPECVLKIALAAIPVVFSAACAAIVLGWAVRVRELPFSRMLTGSP